MHLKTRSKAIVSSCYHPRARGGPVKGAQFVGYSLDPRVRGDDNVQQGQPNFAF